MTAPTFTHRIRFFVTTGDRRRPLSLVTTRDESFPDHASAKAWATGYMRHVGATAHAIQPWPGEGRV